MLRALLLVALSAAAALPAGAQLLESVRGGRVVLPRKSVTWGKNDVTRDVSLKLTPRVAGKAATLVVGRDSPNGTRLLVLYGDRGEPLPADFGKGFPGFGAFGDPAKGFLIQAAEHDFDADGVPELVVAVGDRLTNLSVNVFRLKNGKGYRRVGAFAGQAKAVLGGASVVLPYGSKGLFREYRYKRGRFVRAGA